MPGLIPPLGGALGTSPHRFLLAEGFSGVH